ncbi:hypothetical protein LCGC14_2336820, partial [marine sediment metagenome]
SFNSDKGLAYYENYKKILKWLDGDSYLPPPIEVNLDPVMGCNLNCYFCITQNYTRDAKIKKLPFDYMQKLVYFLADWGVKGLCLSGGGEPTLHQRLPDLIHIAALEMDVAVVTNATNVIPELLTCRWVALSVDAASRETYETVKGKDLFDKVCSNISNLVKQRNGSKTDLCFKFLILPENQYEIFDACKLAKALGVQDFHARPVDFERSDIAGARPLPLDIEAIHRQFEQCHEIETDDFHVYTITHKFDTDFHVKCDFSSCLAASLVLPVLTDGNAYICVEHKMEEEYCLGSFDDILNWWGGDRHRQMIKDIIPQRDCSRCIYSSYHQQIEAVKTDSMCLSFP